MRKIIIIVAMLLCCAQAFAEEITLKTGVTLRGSIDLITQDMVVFNTQDKKSYRLAFGLLNKATVERLKKIPTNKDGTLVRVLNKSDAFLQSAKEEYIKGNVASALKDAQKAIALDKNNALAYIHCGFYLIRLRQHDKAIESFNKAMSLKPPQALITLAYIGLGDAYTMYVNIQNPPQYDKAYDYYHNALSLYQKAKDKRGIEMVQARLKVLENSGKKN